MAFTSTSGDFAEAAIAGVKQADPTVKATVAMHAVHVCVISEYLFIVIML